jgi:hypothetical protein
MGRKADAKLSLLPGAALKAQGQPSANLCSRNTLSFAASKREQQRRAD